MEMDSSIGANWRSWITSLVLERRRHRWLRIMWVCRKRQAGGLPHAENAGEVKRAAAAHLALHPNAASHHFHQPRADGQTKTGASVFTGSGPIGLPERLKNESLTFGRNSDAG